MSPRFLTCICVTMLLLSTLGGTTLIDIEGARAQEDEPRFLISPYFGNEELRSYFDHEYPTYHGVPNGNGTNNGDNLIFTRYDGQRWTNLVNCTSTVNCYDGHNGLDFGLEYEQVLAAADGTVVSARWDLDNCHSGPSCLYGLKVEIEHNVSGKIFRTRYGHLTTLAVVENQVVHAGQIVGTSGSTGASTGPHLHFDVRVSINGQMKAIDPFGWQPSPGAPVQDDPWAPAQYGNGAESWCMWSAGEWADFCDPNNPGDPLPEPAFDWETIVDDTDGGFWKGSGGLELNPCAGVPCPGWWDANQGWNSHTYHSVADGNTQVDNWASWMPDDLPSYNAPYEVFVYIPSIYGYPGNTFTWQAKYTVFDGSGNSYTALVDEHAAGTHDARDKWLSIGVYFLKDGGGVYTTDATVESRNTHCPNGANQWCRMTADAVKFVRRGIVILPDVINTSIWESQIAVVNNSPYPVDAVAVFQNGGAPIYWDLEPGQAWAFPTSCCTGTYYAPMVLYGFGNLSAVFETHGKNIYKSVFADNSAALDDSHNPGWGETGYTLFAPSVLKNYYTWYSYMRLSNAGLNTAHVTIEYYDNSGYKGSYPTSINSYSAVSITYPQGQPNVLYAARVISDQPLAGVVRQWMPNGSASVYETYNLSSQGGNTVYAPLIMDNYYGWNTSINIQNTTGGPVWFDVYYYAQNGVEVYHKPAFQLNGYASVSYYSPNEPLPVEFQMGSAKVTASQPIVLVVNQSASPGGTLMRGLSYNGALAGSSTVIAPDVRNHYPAYGQWVTSLNVQNVGNTTTTATVSFQGYTCSASIHPNGMYSFYLPQCVGTTTLQGAATITTNNGQPITVVVNQSYHTAPPNTDYAFSYSGINK